MYVFVSLKRTGLNKSFVIESDYTDCAVCYYFQPARKKQSKCVFLTINWQNTAFLILQHSTQTANTDKMATFAM